MAEYSLEPVQVKPVETKYRKIHTKLPVPESLPIFEELQKSEPRSMLGQPPVVWHSAEDFTVSDRWGNRWIDWSSCVLVSNAGHGRKELKKALTDIIDQGLLASYVFVHEQRAKLVSMLTALAPDPSRYQTFLLSTGSEAVENCIKLMKTWALEKFGPERRYIVSFQNGFHGRTMGSQLAGGMDRLKKWIGQLDPSFVQVPFPDGFKNEDVSFDLFLSTLDKKGIVPSQIAGVVGESYQGVGPDFFPVKYAQAMEKFCRENGILLCMDEVQSGFGRTGKMFCYENYGVTPDLVSCGKGISSSLPISAVIGRKDIMDLYAPGSMTSTHSASPLPVAAAIASLKLIQSEHLVEKAAHLGEILIPELHRIREKHPAELGCVQGLGLVAGIQVVEPGTKKPNAALAQKINLTCFHKGLLMFAPVGIGGECLKIAPPLTITEEALRESIAVFEEAIDEFLG